MKELPTLTRIFFMSELKNRAFLVPSFLFPVLMLTLMAVAGKSDGARGDISYASFLTPGILCMAYAAVALVGVPVMIGTYREKGILRHFKTSRLPISFIAISILLTQLAFMVLQTFFVLVYARIVFSVSIVHLSQQFFLVIPVFIVGLTAILATGFFLSSFVANARAATMSGNMFNLVAIFLGGVFFPVDVWPAVIQPLTWINPLTWIIEGLRKAFLYGTLDFHTAMTETGYLLILAVVFMLLGVKLFKYE